MFKRSQSKLGAAALRALTADTSAACWDGLSTGLTAASRMALQDSTGHVGPRVLQNTRQSFSTFASRLHLQQYSSRHSGSQCGLPSVAHPSHTLFHAPGPQGSGRVTWSGRGRSMLTMSPDNVVYGIMAANAAVFLGWQQPSWRQFMTTHFTGTLSSSR